MNIPYVFKKCTKCGKWLVASEANFRKRKDGKYGLRGQCKKCIRNQRKQYREANKEKVAKQKKQWYEANRDRIIEQHKQYYEDNKEKSLERQKQYYEDNKEKVIEYNKQYYKDNKEKILERSKRYYQSPQGQALAFNRHQRRRIKEEQQGIGITKDQWLEMMKFFDWKCAYSGEYLGGSDNSFNRTIDHIVPLNSGGDNMIWNVVPMTKPLNSSKHTKDMLEWYREQDFYNPNRLAKIYEWQEYAFSKWGKDTEYFNSGDIQIKLI